MKSGYIAAVLVIGSGLCLAQSEPPSLGEIARKNHAAAQHEKKARIVITDDDLRASTPLDPESASRGTGTGFAAKTASTPAAASPPGGASQTKETKQDPGKSTVPPAGNEVDQLKKELDGLKAQQEGWKGSAQRYEKELAAEHDEFRRAMYQDALDNDRRNITMFQKKIDDTESKLAGAEDAASKAGTASGQPGAPPH